MVKVDSTLRWCVDMYGRAQHFKHCASPNLKLGFSSVSYLSTIRNNFEKELFELFCETHFRWNSAGNIRWSLRGGNGWYLHVKFEKSKYHMVSTRVETF